MPSSPTTPFGSITDVPGVAVGHAQRRGRGWQTGTTVVLAADGATPGVDVRGGGPGTRETDALAPENLVQTVHAICLTGGSAYGLAAADGVMSWLEERELGFPVAVPGQDGPSPAQVVPVVPTAVIFDLARGGNFTYRPDASFGRRAVDTARRNQSRWGTVGAGTGAKAGTLQGGIGTASRVVTIPAAVIGGEAASDVEVTVGAVAVVNSNGTPIDPRRGLPWEPSGLPMRRPSAAERRLLDELATGPREQRLNTTIGVVATSAILTKTEVGKLAGVAHDGMARAVRPAHSMFDGDTVFGLATGIDDIGAHATTLRSPGSRHAAFNLLLAAGADVFAAACTHAVVAATTIGTQLAYRDVCPSAFAEPAG